jgi:lipopolysaccharide export system protein LptA
MLGRLVFRFVIVAALGFPCVSNAQRQTLPGLGDSKAPLEIEADNGLELIQERKLVIAKGNVVAKQGPVELRADIVSASYEDGPKGQRRIRRVDAVGNVNVKTEKERLYGDRVTYDLVRELMIVTGKEMRIEAAKQTITADQSMEYWGAEHRAVARGNALVTQDATSMRADVIEAILAKRGDRQEPTLKPDQKVKKAIVASSQVPGFTGAGAALNGGNAALERIRAWGNVVIRTGTEVVEGDRGDFDVASQIATLTGNVQVTRGKNKLSGEQAIVNLRTGVSKVTGTNSARVRTILYPGGAKGAQGSNASTVDPAASPVQSNKASVGGLPGKSPSLQADDASLTPQTPAAAPAPLQVPATVVNMSPVPPARRPAIPGGNPVPRPRPQGLQ